MLSPKMQRSVRINESQLLLLAEKARYGEHLFGPLYKRTSDNSKWQLRWFNLYQVGRECDPRLHRGGDVAYLCVPFIVRKSMS